jgi:hypothetical protein
VNQVHVVVPGNGNITAAPAVLLNGSAGRDRT